MKKIAILLLMFSLLVGCSSQKSSEELEEVSIMLDWYPNAVHSAIYVAEENGYFEEEGIKVKIEMPADTNDPLKLAAAGKVDLAITYQSQLLLSRAEGIPIVSLAAYVRHSLDGIMFKEESGIQSPKDLEGKKVGYPSTSVSEAIVASMVENDGGDINKVELIDVGWDLMQSLATDNVDALVGAYVNHEAVKLEKEGYNIEMLDLPEFGVPDNYELVVATGEETLAKKEELFKKFWSAVTKGQEKVVQDPEASLQVLLDSQNSNFPLNEDVEKESLRILLPLMDGGDAPFGYQEEKSWKAVADWLYETKVIDEPVDPSHAFVNIVE